MIILYSNHSCYKSHQCRFALFEKDIDFEIREAELAPEIIKGKLASKEFRLPIMVDRDLILDEPSIINSYIDERFPHPQLIPGDVMERARTRLFMANFETELFSHLSQLQDGSKSQTEATRQRCRNSLQAMLMQLVPLFQRNKYILGEQFSILDVAIAPLLWRLDHHRVKLGRSAAPLRKYAERVFSRPAFTDSMTPFEKVMRS